MSGVVPICHPSSANASLSLFSNCSRSCSVFFLLGHQLVLVSYKEQSLVDLTQLLQFHIRSFLIKVFISILPVLEFLVGMQYNFFSNAISTGFLWL